MTIKRSMLLCLLASTAWADRVEWSDGRTWAGTIDLTQGIQLHDGRRVRAWEKNDIARIDWRPATQRMERAWQFIEAGRTAKQFTGAEYPTAELEAEVTLSSGERVAGHLITTVFYLTAGNQTEKLVIKHKLRGAEGAAADSIVFPVEAVFDQPAPDNGAVSNRQEVTLPDVSIDDAVTVVSRARMATGVVKPLGNHRYQAWADGADLIWAVRKGDRIEVAWRGLAPDAVRQRVEQGLADLRDFFDDRRLLSLAVDPQDPTTAWTLLLLVRVGQTTLGGGATQPWRLEIWKWRLGDAADDITAAARVVLFRGIRNREAPLPKITTELTVQ